MNTEVLSYSRSKGVFAGLTLEGAVIEQDNDSTFAIYDHEPKFRYVLSGKLAAPTVADGFLKEVNQISARAREDAGK
jgi:lipid-binding SYLF domain-containing protein